jgi:hypothetical protein
VRRGGDLDAPRRLTTGSVAGRGCEAPGRPLEHGFRLSWLIALCLLAFACLSPVEPRQTLWEATLVPAPGFAGLSGSIGVVSEERFRRAEVGIQIMGGPPSSVLPWRLRAGACGAQAEVVGAPVSYPPLTTDDLGSAAQETVLTQALRAADTYSVELWRGPEDEEAIACGMLVRR